MATSFFNRKRIPPQNTLPYRADSTQRFMSRHREEHYNASSDYIYGLENRQRETPPLSLDEYLDLVNAFRKIAFTLIATPKPTLPTYEELEVLVEIMDEPQFEEQGL